MEALRLHCLWGPRKSGVAKGRCLGSKPWEAARHASYVIGRFAGTARERVYDSKHCRGHASHASNPIEHCLIAQCEDSTFHSKVRFIVRMRHKLYRAPAP